MQEILCCIIIAQSEGDVFAYVKKKDMFFATQRSEVIIEDDFDAANKVDISNSP